MEVANPTTPLVIGRYAIYGEIAAGGMATVHFGRLLGPVGFSRTVAIKRLHAHFAKDPEFAAMFLDEARLAARIQHPNVVQTLDVVAVADELFLVMDYVQGESLFRLIRASGAASRPVPLEIASAIVCGALHGLHAAHEAKAEDGEPLGIVHRDVSPQNVLVGSGGVPLVLDFGVAKAAGRAQTTQEGQLKGKLAYMSPEQIRAEGVDRRTDVYAMGVVLWETLTLQRLFSADDHVAVMQKVLEGVHRAPSAVAPGVPSSVDEVVLRALELRPADRYPTAREMALALEAAVPMASSTRIADWVEELVGDVLAQRAKAVAAIESHSGVGHPTPPVPASGAHDAAITRTSLTTAGVTHSGRPPAAAANGRRYGKTIAFALLGLLAVAAGGVMLSRSGEPEGGSPAVSHAAAPPGAPASSPAASPNPPPAVAPDEPKVGVLALKIPDGYTVRVDGASPGSPESHGAARVLSDGKLELRGAFQKKFLVAVFDRGNKRVMVQDVYLYDNKLDPETIDTKVGEVPVAKPTRKAVEDLPVRF